MSRETQLVWVMFLIGGCLVVVLGGLGVVLLSQPEAATAAPVAKGSPLPPTPAGGASPTVYVLSTLPPATDTPVPTATPTVPPATNTPVPTDTPPATHTPKPQPTQPPAPANPAPQPTQPPAPPVSRKGLTATFRLEGGPAYGVNQSIWFVFQLLNPTTTAVSFGRLGVSVEENGANQSDLFHTTYSETTLQPGDSLLANYRDHIEIPRAGTFVLRLAICYPNIAACDGGAGEWENLSNGVTVTVQ
ncbi:MAG: hypothetical protein JXB47_04665 [Anaerolineae bacterium]|nr:hypothetical protein [Anaerolineae bacterium]